MNVRKVPARRTAVLTSRELLHIARAAETLDWSWLPKRVARILSVTWRDGELDAWVRLTNGRVAYGWFSPKALLTTH